MASGASYDFERTRCKVTENMERNVSRHRTELYVTMPDRIALCIRAGGGSTGTKRTGESSWRPRPRPRQENRITEQDTGRKTDIWRTSGANYSVVSEQLRTQLRTPMFSEHNPILRTACGKVVEAIRRCMLRVNLNGVLQTFKFLGFQQCSHDLILGSDFFKATDDIIDCGSAELQIGDVSPNE
ncbi:uncharacterized protein TNCV_4579031 [Trichonephila clavipes]|nr:uncharacterized protein TNCV_4579031 [Trichonephila clavipes]